MPLTRKRKLSSSKIGRRVRRRFSRRSLARSRFAGRLRRFNIHRYVRKTTTTLDISGGGSFSGISGNDVAVVSGHLVAQLSLIPGYTDFTALYDQFRVDKVILRLVPRMSRNEMASTSGVSNQPNIKLYCAADYDSGGTVNTEALIQEYSNCRQCNPYRTQKFILYPKPIGAVIRNIASSSQADMLLKNRWIDCQFIDTQFAFLRYVIPPSGVLNYYQIWDCHWTYIFSMKSPR